MRSSFPAALGAMLLVALASADRSHADGVLCPEQSEGVQAPVTHARFFAYRPGTFGVDLRWRDTEFLWDSLYAGGLTLDVQATIRRLAGSLVDSSGRNPLGVDVSDMHLLYDYFRRQGVAYSTDAQDSIAMRIGWYDRTRSSWNPDAPADAVYKPSDRSHLDVYLWSPARGNSTSPGLYPSEFLSPEEDMTSDRAFGDTRPANAIHSRGPAPSSPLDPTGTGWTRPNGEQNVRINHEFQHTLPPYQNFTMTTEMFSAGAEAVGGNADTTARYDFPYTFSLMGFRADGVLPMGGCRWVRQVSSAYQTRSAFAAYLAYHFRGADTSATIAAIEDDLLHRWATTQNRRFSDLRGMLNDAELAEGPTYFGGYGVTLDDTTRLGLLLHNWRVANYANAPHLDVGQYGYPPRTDFSPARQLGAWRSVDDCHEMNDVITIPPEVVLDASRLTRDTTLAGWREYGGKPLMSSCS
uniref:Uncharacterized protein n=1 Tax=Eiseniibacteriota bacterium TaxID=2212470 RepID=A0A832MLF8_UNCEI